MRHSLVMCMVLLSLPAVVWGQVTIGPEGPKIPEESKDKPGRDQPQVFEWTISPAPEPSPALKYRFDVPLTEQQPGNCVPFYYRALVFIYEGYWHKSRQNIGELYNEVNEVPLSEFPNEKVRELLNKYQTVFRELQRAHIRKQTDWGWHMEELENAEWYGFPLSEIQASRTLGRLLYIKGRLELAEGRFEDAEQTLQMGYHLAQSVSEPPTIVDDLVGIAIASMMNDLVREWISIEGSPNLYWAIAALPEPFINGRNSIAHELAIFRRIAPWLENAAKDGAPPAVWRARFVSLLQTLIEFDGSIGPLTTDGHGEPPSRDRVAELATLMILRAYPAARDGLLERGYTAEQIEEMPVGKVVALQQRYIDNVIADALTKAVLVSSEHAYATHLRTRDMLREENLLGPPPLFSVEPFPIMGTFSPAVGFAVRASLRLRTRLAGLRTLEAIRMHAAKTGGLPESLEDIEVVPVPDNPRTDEPFEYSLDGDTAILDVVVNPNYQRIDWRFKLKLASPGDK